MTVVSLNSHRAGRSGYWRPEELQQLCSIFTAHAARGSAGGWATDQTEQGDPQFYLLSEDSAQDCLLCISRIERNYILEDGEGGIIAEHKDLATIAERAVRLQLGGSKLSIAMRLGLIWIALRSSVGEKVQSVEEKVEPLLAEPLELMTHVFPQLAALA